MSMKGFWNARMVTSIEASYARLPPVNHSLGSGLTRTSISEELRKRATVSLRATEIFILVAVSCLSPIENFLMTNYKRKLTTITNTVAPAEIIWTFAWSALDLSVLSALASAMKSC
jgi:hypothetical protein